jgi:hypothetical protein
MTRPEDRLAQLLAKEVVGQAERDRGAALLFEIDACQRGQGQPPTVNDFKVLSDDDLASGVSPASDQSEEPVS